MTFLAKEAVKTLIQQAADPCVSLYMPTHAAGPDIRQDPIRFKNLLRQAESQLVATGLDAEAARQFLQPVMELDQADFWRHQNQGLALFIAADFWQHYQLPLKFEELVVVADQFHLKPLMPLLTENGKFYILVLNRKHIRFFEATRDRVQEPDLPDLPRNLEETLQYEATAKTGQFRIATSRGSTANSFQQPGTFHGQGSPDQDTFNRDILQFFHQVDTSLHEYLHNQRGPLVIAGIDPHLALYRQANTYPELVEAAIAKNVEDLTPEALRDQAWSLVYPYFDQTRQAAVEQVHQLAGTGQASLDLTEIVQAAYFHRVQSLFVPIALQCWGRFDPATSEVHFHAAPEPGDVDLFDFAALHTFVNEGTVYAVAPDQIPAGHEVAAVFRY